MFQYCVSLRHEPIYFLVVSRMQYAYHLKGAFLIYYFLILNFEFTPVYKSADKPDDKKILFSFCLVRRGVHDMSRKVKYCICFMFSFFCGVGHYRKQNFARSFLISGKRLRLLTGEKLALFCWYLQYWWVLQISNMIVGFLVNSDPKRLWARAPGWPLLAAMLC